MPAAKFGISGNSAAGVRADPEGKDRRKTQAKEERIMEIPRHVAIILDGNGRWAKSRNMPRNYGHVKGAANVEVICRAADELGIKYLTVYLFSTENWRRSQDEVKALMKLFHSYTRTAIRQARENNMRCRILGKQEELDDTLRKNLKVYEGANGSDPKAKEKSEKTVGDARRLERTLPPAWAFRLMSNQFAVVSTSEETHEKILGLLHERFENPWYIRGLELNLLLTVAEMPETSSFAEGADLYKAVEIVLPAVPKGDTVTVSDRELAKIERHLMLETSLEKALAEETLDVRFQPILSTATGRYSKVEALARFTHDEWGDVPASEFIPIAEKRGLVAQIDEFVLRKACDFIKSATDVEIEYVGVNISITEMASSAFPKKVRSILDEYGIPYRKIVFEITENALMTSLILMIENLQELSSVGFQFAVDNLSLGKGDIAKLAMLPFSIVKLDRSVLEEVETSARSRILFENTIDVLKKIEIQSVVVGCETTVQSQWISECSPDGIQGFYYARPMDKNGCLAFIQRNNAQTPKKPGRDNFIIVTE